MHFTFWSSRVANVGGHREITWGGFLAFVTAPQCVEDKNALAGWSPVRFAGNARRRDAAELVSAVVLDDDVTGLPLERAREAWADVAGVIHTTHSHTDVSPKYRIVLRVSRDMTADEHARVWVHVRDLAVARGQTLDASTRDPSRLWYVPAHRIGATYSWVELTGAPLDVDAILALVPVETPPAPAPTATPMASEPAGRRQAMALALGSAWPAKGRHQAQLALAGALRSEGFTADEAVDFLCTVCRVAGNEDKAKREATVRHTYERSAEAPMTGWTRLKAHIDGPLVDAVRAAVARDATWTESVERRLAAIAAPTVTVSAPDTPEANKLHTGNIVWTVGGYDAELPPIHWQIDTLIGRGEVVMLVAHGNSLKTWLAFSMGHAIASGRPWLGKYAVERGRAGLADFENDDYEMRRRLKLLGVRDADVGDRLLRSPYPAASFGDPETWFSLGAAKLDYLSIDSFNAASPETDENDARAAMMIQYSSRFANATKCTVVWIHHARKGSGGDRRETVRGSSALFAACDRIFAFDEPEKRVGGIVTTTMRPLKDGAGRSPAPIKVELSDQGLKWIEYTEEGKEEKPLDNRSLVLKVLQNNPTGVAKEKLVKLLTGAKQDRYKLLTELDLEGEIVEFVDRGQGGKYGATMVMLRR